jgi:hypothetical protein
MSWVTLAMSEGYSMKLAGFLLLLAGWGIVLSTIMLIAPTPARTGFVLAGIAVEALGLILVARSHLEPKGERQG